MSWRSTRNCRSRTVTSATLRKLSSAKSGTAAAASRNAFSTACRSASVQRRMKGKSARLRARRMRLEMTISLCGPVPRSHSGLRLANSSSFTAVFLPTSGRSLAFATLRFLGTQWSLFLLQLANLIAHLRGPLVVFLLLGVVHLAPQPDQLGMLVGAGRLPLRPLAGVLGLAVDISDQRRQLLLEADIIVRATQPALVAEFEEGDTADGAGPFVELGQLLGGLAELELFGEHIRQRRGDCRSAAAAIARCQILLGAALAEMQL